MQTLIPSKVLARWETNATMREKTQIYDLCELRHYITEAKAEGERVVMQMYAESAPKFRMGIKSLQNKVIAMREYSDDKLINWIENGYAFDTISRVGELYNLEMTGDEAPADILDDCINNNGEGKTPTADEIETLILERNGFKPADYFVNRFAWKLCKAAGLADSKAFLKDLLLLVARHKDT